MKVLSIVFLTLITIFGLCSIVMGVCLICTREYGYKEYPQISFDEFISLYNIAKDKWVFYDEMIRYLGWKMSDKIKREYFWMLANPLTVEYDNQKFIIRRKDKLKALAYLAEKDKQEKLAKDAAKLAELNEKLSKVYKSMLKDVEDYKINAAQDTADKIGDIEEERLKKLKTLEKKPILDNDRFQAVPMYDEHMLYLYDNLKDTYKYIGRII